MRERERVRERERNTKLYRRSVVIAGTIGYDNKTFLTIWTVGKQLGKNFSECQAYQISSKYNNQNNISKGKIIQNYRSMEGKCIFLGVFFLIKTIPILCQCYTMVGIRFVRVLGCQSENWREAHTRVLSTRSPVRPEVDEGSKVREKKWVSKREQKRSVSLIEQSKEGEGNSQQKSAWLVAFVGVSLEYTLALAHRMHKKCHGIPPLALGADPSSCLFVCSFLPPSRLCVLCVLNEMCNAPGRRWEKPLDDLI